MLLACTAVLGCGFIAVLLLNTIISQGAFRQHELEIELILLAEKEESLANKVQLAESPIKVEKAARKLGMVPAAAPVFLRLSDGKVLGEPVPATAPPGRVSFAGAPGIQPTPKPEPSPGATDGASVSAVDPDTDPDADPGLGVTSGIDPGLDPETGLGTGEGTDLSEGTDPAAAPEPTPGPAASAGPIGDPTADPTPEATQQGVSP